MRVLFGLLWDLAPLCAAGIAIGWLWSLHRRCLAQQRLKEWAEACGWRVVHCHVPFVLPLWLWLKLTWLYWPFGDKLNVCMPFAFHVIVQEAKTDGRVRAGWVVFGFNRKGLHSPEYELFWKSDWTASRGQLAANNGALTKEP